MLSWDYLNSFIYSGYARYTTATPIATTASTTSASSTASSAYTVQATLPQDSKNYLTKLQDATFQAFAGKDPASRKGARQQLGAEVLAKAKAWKTHVDWKQFALMQCPGIIRETSLEGEDTYYCARAAARFIDSCIAKEGLFFSVDDVKEDTFLKLRKALSDYSTLCSFRPLCSDEPSSVGVVESSVKAYLSYVQASPSFSTTGVYIPLGYRSGSANQGHSIACKMVEKGEDVVLSIFNLGNGSEPHPIVDYTLEQKKSSFSFFPIAIPKKLLFSDVGTTALCQAIRYIIDAPLKEGAPYDGRDFYDIFFQFLYFSGGAKLLDLPYQEEYGADLQISGTCPENAVQCVMDDLMIQERISREGRSKVFLNRKFHSLLEHYNAFVANPACHPCARELLLDAARSFGATIKQLYKNKQIPEQEFIGAQATLHEIVRAARKTPYPTSSTTIGSSLMDFDSVFEKVPHLAKPAAAAQKTPITALEQLKIKPPVFESMKTLPDDVKGWIKTAARLPEEAVFEYVSDCTRALPIPKSRDPLVKEEPWNDFPKARIEEMLHDFEELLALGLRGQKVASHASSRLGKHRFSEQFLMIYSILAASDKLARLLDKQTKLEGFSCPFLPPAFKFKPNGFTSLPLKEDNERYTNIFQYLTDEEHKTDEGHRPDKVIFPIAPKLDVKQFVHNLLYDDRKEEYLQGKNHIEYLSKLLGTSSFATESYLASYYTNNWMSALPAPVRSLYYFSFLANILLTAEDMPFPRASEFAVTPISGTTTLKIEDPFFKKEYLEKLNRDHLLYSKDHKPKLEDPIRDKRFQETESETHFFNFYHPALQALTTNDAVCYTLSEENRKNCAIDEPAMRTLLYDTRKDALSLWQALQDFSLPENHYLLSHKGVQNALESCFFKPRFLLEHMDAEPEDLIQTFRDFCQNALYLYNDNPSQLAPILFIIRMGISFETYTPTDAKREDTLNLYRKTLEKFSKLSFKESIWPVNIQMHRLFLESQSESTKPEDFYFRLFHSNIHDSHSESISWIRAYFPRMIRSAAYKWAPLLQDEDKRSDLCNTLLHRLISNPEEHGQLPSKKWEGDFPEYSCGDYVIDFFHAHLKHKKYKGTLRKLEFWGTDRDVGINRSKYGNLFWKCSKDHLCTSLNGKLKWDTKNNQWTEELFDLKGSAKDTEVLVFHNTREIDDLGQDFLNYTKFLPFIHYKQDDGSVITYDILTGIPYLVMEGLGSTSVTYRRLDEKGNKLPFVLSALSKVRFKDPLYRHTTRYVGPSEVLCFVGEQTKEVEELWFYKLGLNFKRDGKSLSCEHYPGFHLIAGEQDLSSDEEKKSYATLMREINSYDGAFTLYNPKTKKWKVLFPVASLSKVEVKGADFSKDVKPTLREINKYYGFEFDSAENCLKVSKGDSNCANAYLAMLFKLQRSYEKANKYVTKIKTSSFFDEKMLNTLNEFTVINDNSPASLAFNLKLTLFIVRNKNLMLEKQFHHKEPNHFYPSFLSWAMTNYSLYLSDNVESKISEKLRLSESEKKMLLLAFRRSYEEKPHQDEDGLNWEQRWQNEQPVLDNQYNVYFSPQRSNTLIPAPQKISTIPPIFKSLVAPNKLWAQPSKLESILKYREKFLNKRPKGLEIVDHPIRVTKKALFANFPDLYNEAIKCDPNVLCNFDFKLQAFQKAHNSELGDLLFWVRHFPEEFVNFPLTSPLTIEMLTEIYKRVQKIPEKYQNKYAAIDEKLKSKITFRIDKDIPLAAKDEKVKNSKIKVAKTAPLPPDLSVYLKETETKLRRLFNSPYKVRGGALTLDEIQDEMCFNLSKDSAQTLSFPKNGPLGLQEEGECLPEVIMKQVILKNNLSYLYKHRPMLTRIEKNELCRLTCEWYHARVLEKLKEEGREGDYLPYDYQKYPEISYFYLKTGKFPRPHQLKVYLWIMENLEKGIKVHFQLGAGDGKTDYLTPLLNLGAERLGLMGVTCVTQSIYPVDKENLSYNMGLVDKDLYFLEVGIHMINQLSSLDLQFIYTQLMQYKSEGKSLLITRHTFDALVLIRDLALKNSLDKNLSIDVREEIGRKIRYSQNILNFFEKSCLLICDESHQNADALTRAIFGVGDLSEIPENERKHMLAIMKPLLANFPKSPTDEEIDALRKSFAKEYLKLIPAIPEPEHKEIFAFWTDKKAAQPAFLKAAWEKNETKEVANLISITGHFLLDLLPDILSLRTNVDHARSLYPQRKYEVPARNEQPSTAEYDDKYRTCTLTSKGNYQRGLSEDDIRFLLAEMMNKADEEKAHGFHPDNTPTNLLFKEWVEKASLKDRNVSKLEDIQLSDERQIRSMHQALGENTEVIDHFLLNHAFVGIGTPTEELSCTTTDAFNGFHGSVSFSATPREDLAYPRCIKAYYRDLDFEKNVKDKWKEPQNSTIVGAENEEDFFKQMEDGKYRQETVLIDPRGFFTSPSKKVAQKWLDNNPKLDGVLYFKQARSTDVDRDEKICLLKRSGEVLEVCGSNIETALKEQHNLDWETLNLGTLYGPAQTESANITQKKGAKACFFVGDGLTTSHAIQAIMRCRGFKNLNQTVTSFFSKALARKIFDTKTPTIQGLFSWTDANQWIEEERRVVLNAFQEIHFLIAKEAKDRIKASHATDTSTIMGDVVDVYRQHAKGLVERNPTEAYEAYGEHEVFKKTRVVLEEYAKITYEKFDYETDYSSVKDAIEEIIADVEKRIAEISTSYDKQTSKHVEQHLELKAQVQKHQHKVVPRPADPLALDGRYGNCGIETPAYLTTITRPARNFFKTDFLSERLYFSTNHVRTGKLKDTSDPSDQYFKPIQFFVIGIAGEVFAEAESNEIFSSHRKALRTCKEIIPDLKHTAFIISANGKLVQKGKGALAPPKDKVDEIMNSAWVKDLVVDAALLNGRLPNPDALLPRIDKYGWKEFETLWKKIVAGLPNPGRAHTKGFEKLKEKYMKRLQERQ